MEENDVTSTCTGTRLEIRNKNNDKFLIQNETSRKSFQFQVWRVVKVLIWNLTRRNYSNSESDAVCFLPQHLTRFSSTQNLTRREIIDLKSDTVLIFSSKSYFLNRLLRFSPKYHQNVTDIEEQLVGKWQQLGVKSFLRVCSMCLSHIWY